MMKGMVLGAALMLGCMSFLGFCGLSKENTKLRRQLLDLVVPEANKNIDV